MDTSKAIKRKAAETGVSSPATVKRAKTTDSKNLVKKPSLSKSSETKTRTSRAKQTAQDSSPGVLVPELGWTTAPTSVLESKTARSSSRGGGSVRGRGNTAGTVSRAEVVEGEYENVLDGIVKLRELRRERAGL